MQEETMKNVQNPTFKYKKKNNTGDLEKYNRVKLIQRNWTYRE